MPKKTYLFIIPYIVSHIRNEVNKIKKAIKIKNLIGRLFNHFSMQYDSSQKEDHTDPLFVMLIFASIRGFFHTFSLQCVEKELPQTL